MSDLQFLEETNKALHIAGVSGSILSPLDWIKKVQGIEHLEYLDEDGVTLNWTLQLMEWYGDYVGRKVKECCRQPPVRKSSLTCKKCGGYFGVDINHRCFKCLEKIF